MQTTDTTTPGLCAAEVGQAPPALCTQTLVLQGTLKAGISVI